MSLPDLFMLGVLVVGGASALLVVTARNVVHAALYLVVALLGVAATFLLLGAEFLAWTQVLVYVGAVIILILFGLMLTRAPIGPMATDNDNTRLAFGVSFAIFAFLVTLIVMTFGGVEVPLNVTPTVAIAERLYVEWAFPLMVLGFLLTVALIGAILLARKEVGDGPDPVLEGVELADRPQPVPTDASALPGPDTSEEVGV